MGKVKELTAEVDLNLRDCPVCGIHYAVPQSFLDRKYENGEDWYCPNGHSIVFSEPENKKLQKQINQLTRERNNFKNRMYHYQEEAEHKEYQRRGYKAHLTRTKNALAKGQCPSCGEHFEDLKEHMTDKHPEFNKENQQKGAPA